MNSLTYDSGDTETFEFFFSRRGLIGFINVPFSYEYDYTVVTFSF